MKTNKTYCPCDECPYSYSRTGEESRMCKICELMYFIDIAPKQGKWEKHTYMTTSDYIIKCSVCGESFERKSYQPFYNYCPACGATMKLASDDTKKTAKWEFWEGWIGNHDMLIEDATCSNCGYVHPTVRREFVNGRFKSDETTQDVLNKLSNTCPNCGSIIVKE